MNSNKSNYIPPLEHGLSNSERIIPSYYLRPLSFIYNGEEKETTFLNVDFFSVIKDDIKNMRKLNKYQLYYITHNLSEQEKNEIFLIMNESFNCLIDAVLTE